MTGTDISHLSYVIFQLIFTYGLSSIVIFLVLAFLCQLEAKNAPRYLCYSLGLGPMTISWLLSLLLWALPHHSAGFYVNTINLTFLLVALCFYKKLSLIKMTLSSRAKFASTATTSSKTTNMLMKLIILLLITLFALVFIFPMTGSDQLDYVKIAKLIANAKSVSIYPILDKTHTGGTIAPLTHPLGFVSLYVWSFFLSDKNGVTLLVKFVTPMFVLYTVALLWQLHSQASKLLAAFSILLLITMPLYFVEASTNHIDAMRIFTFFLSFILLYEIINKPSNGHIILAGYAVGMSLFSHSIALIALPMYAVIYMLFVQQSFASKTISLSIIFAIGLAFVLPRYYVNYMTFHSIIEDNSPVWSIPSLHYTDSLNIIRGIATTKQQWVYGFFKGFTKPSIFGLSYWVLVLSLFLLTSSNYLNIKYIKQRLHDTQFTTLMISLMVVLMFYSMVFLSLLLGINTFIKNDRYMMTIQPFIAIIGANIIYGIYNYLAQENLQHAS